MPAIIPILAGALTYGAVSEAVGAAVFTGGAMAFTSSAAVAGAIGGAVGVIAATEVASLTADVLGPTPPPASQ